MYFTGDSGATHKLCRAAAASINWIRLPFTSQTLLIWLAVTIVVTLLRLFLSLCGAPRKYGGTRQGVWGSIHRIGCRLFLFPPVGIICGAIPGSHHRRTQSQEKTPAMPSEAGFGSFVGLLAGTLLKLIASGWMAFLFFTNIG
ncbi:MAG: DUF456 domain-containing protein [Bacteroidales bacterium]|nr:DUF456 domain-containing protein [Bacteroidales bacterium]